MNDFKIIETSENESTVMIVPPSGDGKSVLDTLLKLQGVQFVAGPVHTDGPKEFAEAARAAHDINACLPELHDIVLEATNTSMSEEELRKLLTLLPNEIKVQIDEWGLGDTEVREQIYAWLQQSTSCNLLSNTHLKK